MKDKGGTGLIQILLKERLCFISYDNQVFLGGNPTIWPSYLHPSRKAFLSPSIWPKRGYNWTLTWKEIFPICFENFQGVPYSHRQNRNRMMNIFILVSVFLYVRNSFFYAYPIQKILPSPFSLARNEVYLGTNFKWGVTDLSWKLPGYSLFPYRHGRQRMLNILLMVNINPLCRRYCRG